MSQSAPQIVQESLNKEPQASRASSISDAEIQMEMEKDPRLISNVARERSRSGTKENRRVTSREPNAKAQKIEAFIQQELNPMLPGRDTSTDTVRYPSPARAASERPASERQASRKSLSVETTRYPSQRPASVEEIAKSRSRSRQVELPTLEEESMSTQPRGRAPTREITKQDLAKKASILLNKEKGKFEARNAQIRHEYGRFTSNMRAKTLDVTRTTRKAKERSFDDIEKAVSDIINESSARVGSSTKISKLPPNSFLSKQRSNAEGSRNLRYQGRLVEA